MIADVAMQIRCPHCLTEQWALTVYAFSYGQVDCDACHQFTQVMTLRQWRDALRVTRKRLAR